jgi:hypothetical protein
MEGHWKKKILLFIIRAKNAEYRKSMRVFKRRKEQFSVVKNKKLNLHTYLKKDRSVSHD